MEKNIHSMKGKGPDAFNDVPEGYFEQLPDTLLNAVSQPTRQIQARFLYTLAAASVVILVLGISLILYLAGSGTSNAPVQYVVNDTTQINNPTNPHITDVSSAYQHHGLVLTAVDIYSTETNTNLRLIDQVSYDEIIDYLVSETDYDF
ncbi:MAG: hypothetical protein KGZ82_14220 [Bacteroidales bacterium]|nr:hypothetical protein [Bacteroidales bacterium]